MSVKSEITTDIYRQMMDLQEKLRQSEAERIRLEEMFTVVVKTFREEEDMRLKSLENRYHTFLEDCAKRSYRNEKILRSVERVESGANALHAKTERLKQLRNHYEAYLERVIPTWRHPALLRYGPSAIQSAQEVEWSRRNHLIPEENIEPNRTRPVRTYTSNPIITSEYFSNRLSDIERPVKPLPSDKNHYDKNYWNSMTREPEEQGKFIYGYDKGYRGDISYQHLEPRSNIQPKAFEEEFVDDRRAPVRGLESALQRKLVLDSRPDMPRNVLYQEGGYTEVREPVSPNADHGLYKQGKPVASPVQREEHWFSDRRKEPLPRDTAFDKSYIGGTPRMTREPVEMKKPEIIVGKIHPESSLKVDYFKNGPSFEARPVENVKPESVNSPIVSKNGKKVEPEKLAEVEVRQPNPQAKWSLLKHRRTIDKLKETLSYEEAQEPKVAEEKKQSDNLSVGSFERLRKENDDTDASQSLSESWQPNGQQVMSPGLVAQAAATPGKEARPEQYRTDDIGPTYQENFQELPQKTEEVYEDNEESYPESYYEQPPKSDYSRDIVSNVIIEEDENEVNMHEEYPEVPAQEIIQGYDQTEYQTGQEDNIPADYTNYNADGTAELKDNQNEYQNYQQSDAGYDDGGMYQTNYGEMQPQGEYTYDNQEGNNYNTNGLEYNTMEQYPASGEAQQYYENQQPEEQGSYPPDQGDNAYQVQNYENTPGMEQYNEGDGTYQQEYNQGQDASYYNQGEYEGYYQSQQEQNVEYQGSNEQENVGYSEAAAYGNVQPDGNSYAEGSNNLPLRQSNLSHLLESDSESFQMEHGSAGANEDSDFDFSMSQKQ